MTAGAVGEHGLEVLAFLVLVGGPIPLALGLAAARSDRPDGLARQTLAAGIGWCVLQAATALVLGSLGRLELPSMLCAESVMGAAGFLWLGRNRRLREAIRCGSPAFEAVEWTLVGVIALMAVTLLVKLARTPITDHDSLGYHLSALAFWYQRRGFVPLEGFHYGAYYPYGWEAVAALFVLPFGEDFLLLAPNLVVWGVFGLAIHLIAVELGASRVAALAAATLGLAVPLVSAQVPTLHIDFALAAFFAAGLDFVLDYDARREVGTLAFLIGALGLVVGVKFSGLTYAAMLVAVLVALVAVRPRRPGSAGRASTGTVLVAVAGAWVGLFWYGRNLLHVGNPLGDVAVAVGGHVLFPGARTAAQIAPSTLLRCFDLGDARHWRILLGQIALLLDGPFLGLVGLAAVALPACVRPRERAGARLVVALLVPLTALAYWATPYSADNGAYHGKITPWIGEGFRYALPFVAVVAALAGLGASRLGRAASMLGVAAATIALARSWSTTMGVVVAAAAIAALIARLPRAGRLVTVGVMAVVVLVGSLRARRQRDLARPVAYGDVSGFLAANTRADEAVGCAAGAPCYVLFGKTLDRRVARVPWSDGDPARWTRDLDRQGIRLLAVARLGRNDPRAERLRAAGFTLTWRHATDPQLAIYQRGRESAAGSEPADAAEPEVDAGGGDPD